MRDIVYAGKFNSGSCFLIRGEQNVIVDPGMAWCGKQTIDGIRKEIGGGPVGAILLTHSHYDHVSALPYFRRQWPEAKVYAADHCAKVILKDSARTMMRRLSDEAARLNGTVIGEDFDENLLRVDEIVREGDELKIGDMDIRVIETFGHTRDCLSFLIDGDTLVSSESIGFYNVDGSYNPQYLVSYKDSLESLEKSKALQPKRFVMPHIGVISEVDEAFWSFFDEGIVKSKDFVLSVLKNYPAGRPRIEAMEKQYWHPERIGGWPQEAYDVNAGAILKTIAREFGVDAEKESALT